MDDNPTWEMPPPDDAEDPFSDTKPRKKRRPDGPLDDRGIPMVWDGENEAWEPVDCATLTAEEAGRCVRGRFSKASVDETRRFVETVKQRIDAEIDEAFYSYMVDDLSRNDLLATLRVASGGSKKLLAHMVAHVTGTA